MSWYLLLVFTICTPKTQPLGLFCLLSIKDQFLLAMKKSLILRSILLFLIVTITILITSCSKDDDHYSIGDFMVSFGVIQKNIESADNSYLILLDNGDKLSMVVSPLLPIEIKNDQRVFVNFAPFDDKVNADKSKTYYGKINYIQNILYKNIQKLSQINNDSIGHDPIIIRDSWVAGDSILTIDFKYYTEGSVHYINLVDNAEGNGKDKPYVFEFRHNARGDIQSYRTSGYVSFKLNPIKITGQHKVDFYIRYTDYDGKRIDIPHSLNY